MKKITKKETRKKKQNEKKQEFKDFKNITFEEETTNECDKNIIDVVSSSIGLLSKELSSYELEGSDYTIKIRRMCNIWNLSKIYSKKMKKL